MPLARQIIITAALVLFTAGLAAQVTVTGHVTAEIVKAVSATPETKNLLSLQQNATPENLDLGNITVSGGSNAICSVVVKTTPLTGDQGNRVEFTAGADAFNNNGVMNEKGTRVLKFKGNADDEILSSADKSYEGQYNVTFAYN